MTGSYSFRISIDDFNDDLAALDVAVADDEVGRRVPLVGAGSTLARPGANVIKLFTAVIY